MFTKKDFLLIQDAINDGIKRYFENETVKTGDYKPCSQFMERVMRQSIAASFAERLKYTSDGFDESTIKRSIVYITPAQFVCKSQG